MHILNYLLDTTLAEDLHLSKQHFETISCSDIGSQTKPNFNKKNIRMLLLSGFWYLNLKIPDVP